MNATFLNSALGLLAAAVPYDGASRTAEKPNIIIIYADDLGYGDVSCYGATRIQTPNIDRAAKNGLRFTNAHCTSASSTPSRYSLLTGEYAWRKPGTGIAAGDAPAIIHPDTYTMADLFKDAGYVTGVVGKWHLGLGPETGADWNGDIQWGPMDLGFDYNFIIPATGDRVPCVYIENRRVVNLDPADPIKVSFRGPIPVENTWNDNTEMLKMHGEPNHSQTFINGIGRMGYMSGGKSARWIDENMADEITGKAVSFIEKNRDKPFFLYFATHDIHVPRVPHPRFAGKSGMGPRGDVILEFDWSVGEILDALERLDLSGNTLVIISSDNGPTLNDGYQDKAVELLGGHKPAGHLRGGKYSAFEGGTRVVFIALWPAKIKAKTSDAFFTQVDLMASFARLTGTDIPDHSAPDSYDFLRALTGRDKKGREWIVEQSVFNVLCLKKDNWKYIEPEQGKNVQQRNPEYGSSSVVQLYDLKADPGEKNNVAEQYPAIINELKDILESVKGGRLSRN